MAAKILLVGSVMMDLILRCERAPEPSESVLGHDYRNAPGGKGSNAAVAAARTGAEVSAYATVGNDSNGEYLLDCWKKEGVDTTFTIVKMVPIPVLWPSPWKTMAKTARSSFPEPIC